MPSPIPAQLTRILITMAESLRRLAGGGIHPQKLDHQIIDLVYRTILRINARFAAVVARLEAGILPSPPPPHH